MKAFWEDNTLPVSERKDLEALIYAIKSVPKHYSAGLAVDIGGTCYGAPTIVVGGGGLGTLSGQIGIVSGLVNLASGGIVGQSVDMLNQDTFTNVFVQGQALTGSGQLRVAVQTADSDVSGQYTDPTSGLAALPTWFQSGGILILNSGALGGGTRGAFVSGQAMQSGFWEAGAFQRPGRYARCVALSGDFYVGELSVTLFGQNRTTGSGGGFSYSPGSGTVNV